MDQKPYNLKEVLSENKYIIPIYQRNYAWGKAEISQLLTDVFEFFEIDESENCNKVKTYYLGSLVYFKRENGDLELIDGQQRHTTITLINLVLKYLEKGQVNSTNLKFDSRKNTQQFIEELYNDFSNFETSVIKGIENIKSAIGIIQEELRNKNIEIFAKNFYKNVKLFLVEVPQDTDLNHYFEIMNNRGEQLEKHEIVKSLLMGKIQNGNDEEKKKEQDRFAIIWDACSDMSDYVWFNFDSDARKELFEKEGNFAKTTFEEILISKNEEKDNEQSLNTILNLEDEKKYDLKDFPKDEKETKGKYKSVIDFPNFLLHVLKLKNENGSLDDKKLLEQFSKSESDPKEFIYDLLKYRTIFDKYIIKQNLADANEDKQNWGIRKLNETFDYTVKTFNQQNEDDDESLKLQTMLYYANPSNTNNTWLQEFLKFGERSDIEKYTNKFFEIAKSKFDDNNLTYPEITIFNLYFIDFLLWKLYKEENISEDLKSLKNKINQKLSLFNNFKFKQLNSKEHLLPQSKANENEKKVLNNLGNLCLISTSQNSAANDDHPKYKKRDYENDNSSLKRLVMFESYSGENYTKENIETHETEMKNLLEFYNAK